MFHIDILETIFKGIIIGILASAPMGPVGILCVQRTLNKGRWYGFVTGIGATVSDLFYAIITGVGMSFVMNLINNAHNKFILQITGSLMLLLFGIYSFRSNPTKNMHHSAQRGDRVSGDHFQPLDHFPLHGLFCPAGLCHSRASV